VDGAGSARQAGDQVEVGVHHVQLQRVQAEVVALSQQRGPALDLQRLQRAVPLIGHGLAQLLINAIFIVANSSCDSQHPPMPRQPTHARAGARPPR
jgi:hypothetical protein